LLATAAPVLGATAALAAALLERSAGLHIVVTSRERLRIPGERLIAVDPLLGSSMADAVSLFMQRAGDASGVFDRSDVERGKIEELCLALDGLPLAIELAAARLDVLTVDELVGSLDRPASAGEGRHDSIGAAIGWSMRLTSDEESDMLAQLVEFSGSFTLDAVAAICESRVSDPRDLTASLARRSLVTVQDSSVGERRFRVLDAVRRHVKATRPLTEPAQWHRRHADFMVEFARRQLPFLRSSEARRAKAVLGSWRADFDAALVRALERRDRATAVGLVGALAWYWFERGLGADAVLNVDRALALEGEPQPDAECAALHAAAFLCAVGPDPSATTRMTHRFTAAAEVAALPHWTAIAQAMSAYLAAGARDRGRADSHLSASEDAAASITGQYAWARLDALMIRGDALRLLDRPSSALDALAVAYRAGADVGHMWVVKGACFVTGKVLTEVGRPRDAISILRTGAARSLESGDVTSALAAIGACASAFVRLDRAESAAIILGALDHVGVQYGYHPEGSDGEYTDKARRATKSALSPGAWRAATSRGAGMDLRAVMGFLADFR
jgi:predicted ATPase